jgi:Cu+-exporting ATPase
MNKLMRFGFAVLAVVFSIASCSETTAQSKEVAQEVVKNTEMAMSIKGMTCAMGCARAIEVELNNLDGIETARVDFKAANAQLTYNSALTSEATIVDFVNNYRNGSFAASVVAAKTCGADCTKSCCAKVDAKKCGADCKKPCCSEADAKKCGADCTKPCCAK